MLNEIARVLKERGQCIIRDSKRLQRWAPRLAAWGIGLTLPSDFRAHYWGSIRSSYTKRELEGILTRSPLQGWTIVEDWMDMMIVKDPRT